MEAINCGQTGVSDGRPQLRASYDGRADVAQGDSLDDFPYRRLWEGEDGTWQKSNESGAEEK